jgi:hypothetical protein
MSPGLARARIAADLDLLPAMPFFAYFGWALEASGWRANRAIGRSRTDRAQVEAKNGVTIRQSVFAAPQPRG